MMDQFKQAKRTKEDFMKALNKTSLPPHLKNEPTILRFLEAVYNHGYYQGFLKGYIEGFIQGFKQALEEGKKDL